MEKYEVTFEEVDENGFPLEELRPYYAGRRYLREQWLRADGVIHRDNGPAVTLYFPEPVNHGRKQTEFAHFWFKDGLIHRELAPAFEAGGMGLYGDKCVGFMINGQYHRVDGFAFKKTDSIGKRLEQKYFLNGVEQDPPAPSGIGSGSAAASHASAPPLIPKP